MFIPDTKIAFSFDELNAPIIDGLVTFTQVSGTTDPNSPHEQSLTSGDLDNPNAVLVDGKTTFSKKLMTNPPTLIDGGVYNITFKFTDKAGNVGEHLVNNVTYDTTKPEVIQNSISFTNNLNNTNWVKAGEKINP